MAIIIGSARHDEHGNCYKNGCAGDQLQTSNVMDMAGEVSMQQFYVHTLGWYILRPKNDKVANAMANGTRTACNNPNIGYDQNNRLSILKYGINTKTPCECDCGTLLREIIKEASGKDVGNFTTQNEKKILEDSGLFKEAIPYTPAVKLYNGDVLVTKTKGHTCIIVEGATKRGDTIITKPTVASGDKTLKNGSKGLQVKYLQQDLNYLGFVGRDGKVLNVDGDFGEKTAYALHKFQDKYSLKVDEKYGPKSAEKMKELIE